MIKGRNVLALITARGGSKGIPRKNLRPLAGRSLIDWSIQAARQSRYVDRLIISSDDDEIIEKARRQGCEAPFVRPAHLARDDTGSMPVIVHAIETLERRYDYLLLLQPTSPFRTGNDIDRILSFCVEGEIEAAVSVTRLKKHPMFMYSIDQGRLKSLLPAAGQLRRQEMPAAYEHNGALYVARTDWLLKHQSFTLPEVHAFITQGAINLDIDTPEDWDYAEFVAARLQGNR